MELTDAMALIAQGLLIIALPIVIAAAFQFMRVQSQKLGDDKLMALKNIAQTAVQYAEQSGLVEQLAGPEKRQMAIDFAERWLKERGVNMELDQIAAVVEAEVMHQFKDPTPPSTDPLARQELIDRAIETAVLAAEQSGLTGTIQNLGPEKKAYAVSMAARYLEQHSISIPQDLAGGLVEAQLLKFRMGMGGGAASEASGGAAQPKG